MENRDNPAFARPSTGPNETFVDGCPGLTKREYIAIHICAAIMPNYNHYGSQTEKRWLEQYGEVTTETAICKDAMVITDALLKELEK